MKTMTVLELKTKPMSSAIAYIIGMTLPLYKEIEIGSKQYIVGSVNHNYNPKDIVLDTPNTSHSHISEAEIGEHFNIISHLFSSNDLNIMIKANNNEYGSISSKNGFSILIDKDSESSDECKAILLALLDKISTCTDDIKYAFIKGCFDGRSSIDWNLKKGTIRYIAVDVERNHKLQEKICQVAASIGINLNLNQRPLGHTKNDQVRIKRDDLSAFRRNGGFFSPFRSRQLSHAIELCR